MRSALVQPPFLSLQLTLNWLSVCFSSPSANALACMSVYCTVPVLLVRRLCVLLLPLVALVAIIAARLGPASLRGLPQRFASFLRTDVSPPGSAQADSLPFYWRWREFSTGNVEHLQREIEKDFGRKPGLSHDAPQRHRSSDAQTRRKIRRNMSACRGAGFCC